MDSQAQAIFRQLRADPNDTDLRERAEGIVRRWHCDPALRFQADLAEGGRLERALKWAMEFSRIGVQTLKQGGLVSCGMMFGNIDTHVRIWYPSFEDLVKDFLPDDVRIVVMAGRRLTDTIDELEGSFPGATIVSWNVAAIEQDGRSWNDFPKPMRADTMDRKALRMEEGDAAFARGGVAPGYNSWVS